MLTVRIDQSTVGGFHSTLAGIPPGRCLWHPIPATGFYEWKKEPAGKVPFHICRRDAALFALAGIYDIWKQPEEPAVVVVDIGMPLLNGLDAGQQIRRIAPEVKLVYVTMNQDADLAAEAFRRGASGYLLKTSAAAELVTAVREVLRGKSYISPLIAKDVVGFLLRGQGSDGKRDKLTSRQGEVLQLLAEGRSMKAVASILKISPRTVAFHKYRIMEVLKVKNNAELVQYAIKNRFVS